MNQDSVEEALDQPLPPGPNGIQPSTPPKDPIAALLLNIFFTCAGYFLIGQWQKGTVALVLFILEIVGAFVVGAATAGCGACVVIPASIAFHAFLAIDCYLQANTLKGGTPVGHWTFLNMHI